MNNVLWVLMGAAVSCLSIAMQWLSIRGLGVGSKPGVAWFISGGFLIRLAIVGVLLVVALRQGLGQALLLMAGMLVTRYCILIWINSRQAVVKPGGQV